MYLSRDAYFIYQWLLLFIVWMLNCCLLCASNATIRASNARKSDKVTITKSSAASDRLYVHMSAMQTILKIVFIVIMLRLRSVHAVVYVE